MGLVDDAVPNSHVELYEVVELSLCRKMFTMQSPNDHQEVVVQRRELRGRR